MYIATTPWDWRGINDVEALCRQAEAAESLGLHSFWLPESHFNGSRALPAPLTLLAAVAARTATLRLGCTSYLLPIRHPLQAAEEVAVLDRLSNGRLILGLGRGLQRDMFRAFGVDSGRKRDLFHQHLDVMRRAWRGESIPDDAGHGSVVLAPLPLQQPEPPLWVAAFGPKALRQVADLGLPYLASPLETIDVLEANIRRHRALIAERGGEVPSAVPVMRTVYISSSATEIRAVRAELARELAARGASAETIDASALVGDRQYVIDRVAEYSERLGMTHLIVRMGLRGVDANAQLRSLGGLVDMAREG